MVERERWQAIQLLLSEWQDAQESNAEQLRRIKLQLIPLIRALCQTNRQLVQLTQQQWKVLRIQMNTNEELKRLENNFDQSAKEVKTSLAQMMQAFNERTLNLQTKIVETICGFNQVGPFSEGDSPYKTEHVIEEGYEFELLTYELTPRVERPIIDTDQTADILLGWTREMASSSRRLINDCKARINELFKEKSSAAQLNSKYMKIFAKIDHETKAVKQQLKQLLLDSGWIADMDSGAAKIQRRRANSGIFYAYSYRLE